MPMVGALVSNVTPALSRTATNDRNSMTIEQTQLSTLCSADFERSCVQFLYREAELLDDNDYEGWLQQCLSESLDYRIPVRTTRERASSTSEFSPAAFHQKDNHGSMRMRVNRLLTEHAFAEDPASRTRRIVTNIRVSELAPDQADVRSYLTVYRSQGLTTHYDLIVGGRHDILHRQDGQWRLQRRLILLNHTILPTPNLGIFL